MVILHMLARVWRVEIPTLTKQPASVIVVVVVVNPIRRTCYFKWVKSWKSFRVPWALGSGSWQPTHRGMVLIIIDW